MNATVEEQLMALLWFLTVANVQPAPADANALKVPQRDAQAEQRRVERESEERVKRMAIHRCVVPCDRDGWLDWRPNGGIRFRCPHDPALLKQAHDERVEWQQLAQAEWEAWDAERRADQPTQQEINQYGHARRSRRHA